MTFVELDDSLPNGFHDADLRAFRIDYVQRRLTFELDIWIAELDVPERRELYRPAVVTMDEVSYLQVEPPRDTKELHVGSSKRIDTGEGVPKTIDDPLRHLRDVGPTTWMFLNEFNSFIIFSAGSASIEWAGPEENRTSK